jgi:pimeloyl-ACP methyl ester carboxylesterase
VNDNMEVRIVEWTAPDGTRLAGRMRGPVAADRRPVVCLPGLTRNSRDFDRLAEALADPASGERTVLAVDYRGRGLSDYADPATYRPEVEAADILAALDRFRFDAPVLVGTSRGGIIAMILASTAPERVGPVVLNDIGPVIEPAGLGEITRRMQAMIGRPAPSDWDQATAEITGFVGPGFPAMTLSDWRIFARQVYREDAQGRPVLDYDPRLYEAFAGFDPEVGIPPFWPLFEALAPRPVLAIRGELSDLLSAATLEEMAARHPGLETHLVPREGHAPLIADSPTIERIRGFLDTHAD